MTILTHFETFDYFLSAKSYAISIAIILYPSVICESLTNLAVSYALETLLFSLSFKCITEAVSSVSHTVATRRDWPGQFSP